ncbi:hypothetical protein WJX72_012423 [[Myrmecia] bisecta]|uniref:Kinesin-like protein n=1 Tax=[Myrmecia] bisecta TaxID=41462 RepID=A0AAW1QT56_9CHLO
MQNPNVKGSEGLKSFTFDAVFDWNSTQQEVYEDTAKPIVESVMEGYNGTVFAYGQTGTGKTHTMDGSAEQRGIIPHSFNQVFDAISLHSEEQQYLVRASFLEIYNEEIRDLLSKNPKNKLDLKERGDSGVYVKGLNSFVVKSVEEITSVLEVGKKNRSVGATLMNQDSSRSHSIFTITVERIDKGTGKDSGHIRVGKLNLVDLAGSERQSKTGATGDRLKEATKINLSLSALGNVISALVDSKSGHIPYRDSKLTRLLQDSLGGNTKTVMIANVGPADYNFEETLSTLRYANRAKDIKNKPRINEDPKDAMLREFQEEILRLRRELEQAAAGQLTGVGIDEGGHVVVEKVVERVDPEEVEHIRAQLEAEMRQDLENQGHELDPETLDKVREDAMRQAEEEAAAIFEQRQRDAAEAAQLAREAQMQAASVQEVQARRDAEQAKKEELARRVADMESKLIRGEARGGLEAVARQTEAAVQQRTLELEGRRRQQAEKVAEILELEEEHLSAEGKLSSLEEEAAKLTRKMKRLLNKCRGVDAEVADTLDEWAHEKEDLLDSLRELHQQMALKNLVIEAFIPQREVQKVTKRAAWDEEHQTWVLQRLSDTTNQRNGSGGGVTMGKRPMSTAGQRRPASEFALAASSLGDHNPRFKCENLLTLELDMPERTTFDYQGPNTHPHAQVAAAS